MNATRMKEIWTPSMRDAWIADATHATLRRGNRGRNYKFFAMPKALPCHVAETPVKDALNQAVASTVNLRVGIKHPFKKIPMRIYSRLVENLRKDYTARALLETRDLYIFVKGSAAYPYLAPNDPVLIPSGDVDIAIYINPRISIFDLVKSKVHTIVMQTLSQYKRCLDNMFFSNTTDSNIRDTFLDADSIDGFKGNLSDILATSKYDFRSPFCDVATRNQVSRQSFIIANSVTQPGEVLHIDVPHFEMCENIPLRKTPFVCSHNRTIVFDRCSNDTCPTPVFGTLAPMKATGCFDLFRLKLNFMIPSNDQNDIVAAELIDITVPEKNDAELKVFFDDNSDTPKTTLYWDEELSCEIRIPSLETAIAELFRILFIYSCPEAKRTKRMQRYEQLLAIREARHVTQETAS